MHFLPSPQVPTFPGCNCTADWLHRPPYQCSAGDPEHARMRMAHQVSRWTKHSCFRVHSLKMPWEGGQCPRGMVHLVLKGLFPFIMYGGGGGRGLGCWRHLFFEPLGLITLSPTHSHLPFPPTAAGEPRVSSVPQPQLPERRSRQRQRRAAGWQRPRHLPAAHIWHL